MDRRLAGDHRVTAQSVHGGGRGAARARSTWRPDLALWVAIGGLVLGILVMIPVLRAIAPSPPSVFAAPVQPSVAPPVARPAPAVVHAPLSTYRSGGSVVARGVTYSALSAQRTTSIALPGGPGSVVTGNLVIVKLQLANTTTTTSTASVGLVDLIDGGVDYRPLLPIASALAQTRWQTLVLKRLAPGATKRVKLVYAVADAVPVRLKLLIGSHATGARRYPIPVASTG